MSPTRSAVFALIVIAGAAILLGTRGAVTDGPSEGSEIVGTAAPAWPDLDWIGADPMALSDLYGRVVLIRFWTDTCPFCAASAPGLQALHERYADQGLTVIGFYHPKPYGTFRSSEEVARAAARLGMTFPVALDQDWETLRRYWLDAAPRQATSASFLIDRAGVIRWVHPGPELHPDGPADHTRCRDDYAALVSAVETLLGEE